MSSEGWLWARVLRSVLLKPWSRVTCRDLQEAAWIRRAVRGRRSSRSRGRHRLDATGRGTWHAAGYRRHGRADRRIGQERTVLGEAAKDQAYLEKLLADRDVHTIEMEQLTGDQAEMLSGLLNGSDVLSENLLLTQAAVRMGGPLSKLLATHNIPADRVIAVDLTVDTSGHGDGLLIQARPGVGGSVPLVAA